MTATTHCCVRRCVCECILCLREGKLVHFDGHIDQNMHLPHRCSSSVFCVSCSELLSRRRRSYVNFLENDISTKKQKYQRLSLFHAVTRRIHHTEEFPGPIWCVDSIFEVNFHFWRFFVGLRKLWKSGKIKTCFLKITQDCGHLRRFWHQIRNLRTILRHIGCFVVILLIFWSFTSQILFFVKNRILLFT